MKHCIRGDAPNWLGQQEGKDDCNWSRMHQRKDERGKADQKAEEHGFEIVTI